MDKEVADLKAKEEKDAFIPPELDMAASKEKKDKAKQAEQKAEKKADEAKKWKATISLQWNYKTYYNHWIVWMNRSKNELVVFFPGGMICFYLLNSINI